MNGVYLGGDERNVCFQKGDQLTVLELGTGKSTILGGSGTGVAVGNDVVRFGAERIASWNPRTGRKLWENATPAGVVLPEAKLTSWRGEITEERWQGCLIRRCRAPWAVAMAGGLAVAGDREIVGIGGKEIR
jgi:hypothetical protein